MSIVKNISFFLVILALLPSLNAQRGYSSASMSMSQQKSAQQLIPQPAEIVVEEYFNYHTHQLPRPQKGQQIALDAQSIPLTNGNHLLQIGISSLHLNEMATRQQVNVVLLIDKSGSMGSGEKLVKSKQAIHRFVEQLQPEDQLSIVTFDSETEVLFSNQPIGDLTQVRQAIEAIQ
ncbi:MAG: VWA domain-containing protein, partial [Bacteroidota bacterium]